MSYYKNYISLEIKNSDNKAFSSFFSNIVDLIPGPYEPGFLDSSFITCLIDIMIPRKNESKLLFESSFSENKNPIDSIVSILENSSPYTPFITSVVKMLIVLNYNDFYKSSLLTLRDLNIDSKNILFKKPSLEINSDFNLDSVKSFNLKSFLNSLNAKSDSDNDLIILSLLKSICVEFSDDIGSHLDHIIDFYAKKLMNDTACSDCDIDNAVNDAGSEFISGFRKSDIIYSGDYHGFDSSFRELINFSVSVTFNDAIKNTLINFIKVKSL